MSHRLDPLTLPLWGSRLIEASAGTGKTWTIAALYLRLVLGHGDRDAGDGYERPLIPSEILVMTFTRAATRELSDRIRGRLLEAARVFRGQAPAKDALLQALLDSQPEGPARLEAAWRLATAAESMDDAAVFTIDGWCQRMLREHAFDSGSAFDEELATNEAALLHESAQDYWRQQVVPLAGEVLDEAWTVWKGLDGLFADVRRLQEQALPPGAGDGTLGETIVREQAAWRTALAALKSGWAERARRMEAWLDERTGAKPSVFDGRKLASRFYAPWLATLAAWADDPQAPHLAIPPAGRRRLVPGGLHEAIKAGASVELPAWFEAFEDLLAALDRLRPPAEAIRLHAAAQVAERMAELKRLAGSFGFADMLHRLDRALDPDLAGEAALRLRRAILAQYPVAMVDEFQDTSPIQARIFDRIYRIADNDRGSALLMIGDPKQSIYGFRGADIHSYLKARRATAGRHYVLGTNHRSTESVVAGINHLFLLPEGRETGEGAFRYRAAAASTGAAGENPLPFVPTDARGRAERFMRAGRPVAGVTLVLDDTLRSKDESMRAYAARCAEQVVTLLNDPATGFEGGEGGFARLQPADIAVLVRTGREAAAVQKALQKRRVASVYLSDQQSVFESREAGDLLHWLRAVASPLDTRLARAALATRLVDLTVPELLRLADDDEAFDLRSEQLRQLHGIWQQQGVLTMLRQTLHLLDLPARWLGTVDGAPADPDGERRLTNFLHLAELLQAASGQLDGEQALVRWLIEQRQGEASRNDDHIVRLESDADLVKVVTVHASKGLEYPLVFLPFASGFRAVEKRWAPVLNLADASGERVLHLDPGSEAIDAADRDRHREDLRLMYVALTRARHAVWVGLAALKGRAPDRCESHRSAIGYLLHGDTPVEAAGLAARVADAVAGRADIALQPAEAIEGLPATPLASRGDPPALRDPAPYAATFERHWSIGSFSALVRDLPLGGALAASDAAVRDDEQAAPGQAPEARVEPVGRGEAASAPLAPWHRFPRGAMPGNFLHDQLEWLAGEGFARVDDGELAEQLRRRCQRQGWGERAADVQAWLQAVTSTVLPPVGVALDALSTRVPEMEFWFPVDDLAAADIDAVCRAQLLSGRPRPDLPERVLQGMFMGFADLVFEHAGRYWVLDYKSNRLGDGDADYTPDALERAMAAHRYDVQAAVYLLALHRLLRSRLGAGYDPREHLGGAVFFFLRGVNATTRGCHHVAPSPALLDGLDRLLPDAREVST